MLQRQMTELLRIAKALGLGLFSLPAMQRNQLTGKTCLWNDLFGCYVPSGMLNYTHSSPVSIQTQSLALRALRLFGTQRKRLRSDGNRASLSAIIYLCIFGFLLPSSPLSPSIAYTLLSVSLQLVKTLLFHISFSDHTTLIGLLL